jgi:hypothetical protein
MPSASTLTRHPAPVSAFRILRAEDFHDEDIKKVAILSTNLFTQLDLRFNSAVLLVFLRQDESA